MGLHTQSSVAHIVGSSVFISNMYYYLTFLDQRLGSCKCQHTYVILTVLLFTLMSVELLRYLSSDHFQEVVGLQLKRRTVATYQIKCSNSKFYTSLKMKMVLSFDIMWRLYETVQLPENAQDYVTLSLNKIINYNSVRK